MRNCVRLGLCMLTVLACAEPAWAALQINELLTNAPGGGDNGFEFVEIKGSASESVANVWFLEIDSNGTTNGQVLNAVNLTSAGTVGTNGLLLIRDAATALSPSPDAATTILINNFNPDLENNTSTFALVTNFTGAVNQDFDTNNDGTFDLTLPWTAVLDAITIQDSGGGDFPHGDDLGGVVLPIFASPSFTPDYIVRDPNNPSTWIAGDVVGTSPGPYTLAASEINDVSFGGIEASPGNENNAPLPSVGVVSVPTFKK
ncbi:MAG: hypothetical protein IT366_01250 [Candidatus Hydrogenedentes bacterium]|nr:hypothetical protein [Candidatus Hydrogenedentota bacterium]